MKFYKKPVITALFILALMIKIGCCSDYSEASGKYDDWDNFSGNYFDIQVEPGVDLKFVYRMLTRRFYYANSAAHLGQFSDIKDKIAFRLDELMERVKQVLDIYPAGNFKVGIRIYKDRKGLNREYFDIFNAPADYKSFYIHKFQKIYVSQEDISDSLVAHEMGHVVVDHYFKVVPPEKIREMIASYVDLHLEDSK